MKLDAKAVAKLKLGDKRDAIHFDPMLPGFRHAGFAAGPAASCCARGSCSIAVAVPPAGCCWARPTC